ncbi:MAG: hypothetical protein MHPSP_001862, partial [Paramarteilia canceri]
YLCDKLMKLYSEKKDIDLIEKITTDVDQKMKFSLFNIGDLDGSVCNGILEPFMNNEFNKKIDNIKFDIADEPKVTMKLEVGQTFENVKIKNLLFKAQEMRKVANDVSSISRILNIYDLILANIPFTDSNSVINNESCQFERLDVKKKLFCTKLMNFLNIESRNLSKSFKNGSKWILAIKQQRKILQKYPGKGHLFSELSKELELCKFAMKIVMFVHFNQGNNHKEYSETLRGEIITSKFYEEDSIQFCKNIQQIFLDQEQNAPPQANSDDQNNSSKLQKTLEMAKLDDQIVPSLEDILCLENLTFEKLFEEVESSFTNEQLSSQTNQSSGEGLISSFKRLFWG